MRKIASNACVPSPAASEPIRRALDLLAAARAATGEVAAARAREKMSSTRAAHAAREIDEIIKVLSLYL